MLNFASQLIAGLISVAVVVIAARWGMKRSGTMLALLAAAVVGAAWSVFSDFTLTYADGSICPSGHKARIAHGSGGNPHWLLRAREAREKFRLAALPSGRRCAESPQGAPAGAVCAAVGRELH